MNTDDHDFNVGKIIHDGKSLVSKYNVLLSEINSSDSPDVKQCSIIFKILDEIVDHMGVFKELMLLFIKDLKNAIYSCQITTDENNSKESLTRIPYFVLTRRILNERDEKADELNHKLELAEKKLFEKQKQFEDSLVANAALQIKIEELEDSIDELNHQLTWKDKERTTLTEEFKSEKSFYDIKESHLKLDLAELRKELQSVAEERDICKRFKQGYDKLQAAFETKMFAQGHITPVSATRRAHLVSNIDVVNRLEEQLLQVQNISIEEYDKVVESHKLIILQQQLNIDANRIDLNENIRTVELENADAFMASEHKHFYENMENLDTEMRLLHQHSTMLMEQLQEVEQSLEKTRPPAKVNQVAGGPKVNQVADARNTAAAAEDHDKDPFSVHERVFSKYAAMIYTSSNMGKSYNEFKDAKYCVSCGAKTVLCPHRIFNHEHVFPLPLNVTHLKIARPSVKINHELMDKILSGKNLPKTTFVSFGGLDDDVNDKRRNSASSTASHSVGMDRTLASGSQNSMLSEDQSTLSDTRLVHPLASIWNGYSARTTIKRRIPRSLKLDRVLSLIEQFFATVIWEDEYTLDDKNSNSSITKDFYDFFLQRYAREDVAYLAAHDFIASFLIHVPRWPILQVFGHVMVNNFDATVLRYVLMLVQFIESVDWLFVEDFRGFLMAVYSTLTEDDIETLFISYVSYSENRISKEKVYDFLLYYILKYREPRFLEMEDRLLSAPQQEFGVMNQREFLSILETLFPVSYDRLACRLFEAADQAARLEDAMSPGFVPISKLAQIASYLSLMQEHSHMCQDIARKIEECRAAHLKETPNLTIASTSCTNRSMVKETTPLFWSYERVRGLGCELSRSRAYRHDEIKRE